MSSSPSDPSSGGMKKRSSCTGHKVLRVAVVLVLASIVILVVVDMFTAQAAVTVIADFGNWLESAGFEGFLAFIIAYIFITISGIPALILTLVGGYVFSLAYGAAGIAACVTCVYIGSTIGSGCAFLIGRYVLRGVASKVIRRYQTLTAFDSVLEEHGRTVVCLLRMSPVVPYNVFNYVMGVTQVQFKDYMVGSVGMLPGTTAYTLIGSMIQNIRAALEGDYSFGVLGWVITGVGLLATVLCIMLISCWTKRKLAKMLAAGDVTEQSTSDGGVAAANQGDAGNTTTPSAVQLTEQPAAGDVV